MSTSRNRFFTSLNNTTKNQPEEATLQIDEEAKKESERSEQPVDRQFDYKDYVRLR